MLEEHHPPEKKTFCRRRFLGLLALAGGGYYFPREPQVWRNMMSNFEELLLTSLPASAKVRSHFGEYTAFLGSLKLRHISVETIIRPHHNRHGSVQNCLPPVSLWKNIVPTLAVVDAIAAELDQRARINSAYRSPAYNASCPGAARSSQHLRNAALDVQFRASPTEVAAIARQKRSQSHFKGGIGVYEAFTHIDTRGRNADW